MEVFAQRLRFVREKRGLSQNELARRCNFSTNQINRYENQVIEPSISALQAIARELGASADYLLGFTPGFWDIPEAGYVEASEQELIGVFRREGWPGVARLSVERLAK
jgi:transcriptional regulator with XRE-family HTH domain